MNSAGVTVVWSEQMHHWCAVMGLWVNGHPRLAIGFGVTPDKATIEMFKDCAEVVKQGGKI